MISPNPRVEKAARQYTEYLIDRYGARHALAIAERMRFEYRRQPQWLERSIEILAEQNRRQT